MKGTSRKRGNKGAARPSRSGDIDASCRLMLRAIQSRETLRKRDPMAAGELDEGLLKLMPTTETVRSVLRPFWESQVATEVSKARQIIDLLTKNKWSPDDLLRQRPALLVEMASLAGVSRARIMRALKKQVTRGGEKCDFCPDWSRGQGWPDGPQRAALEFVGDIEGMSRRIADHVGNEPIAIEQRKREALRRFGKNPEAEKALSIEYKAQLQNAPQANTPRAKRMRQKTPAVVDLLESSRASELARSTTRTLRKLS